MCDINGGTLTNILVQSWLESIGSGFSAESADWVVRRRHVVESRDKMAAVECDRGERERRLN